jgi:hypothetical protein
MFKWVLVVMIFGQSPMETGLEFADQQHCAKIAMQLSQDMVDADAHNTLDDEGMHPTKRKLLRWNFGVGNVPTCVPVAKEQYTGKIQ